MSAIDDKWQQIQWIGQPVDEGAGSAEMALPDGRGRYNHFEGGSIYWRDDIGAHTIHNSIRDAWAGQGWENGRLGYPISDTRRADGVTSQTFQHGTIVIRPGQAPQIAGNID